MAAHTLGVLQARPVHSRKLKICDANELAWFKIPDTVERPPVSQPIPDIIVESAFSILSITFAKIPAVHFSTAQTGALIVFVAKSPSNPAI